MSPSALSKCGAAAAPPPTLAERQYAARAPGASRADVTLGVVAAAELALARARGEEPGAGPTANSCLYFSMLYPLLSVPITAMLW